MKKMFSILLVLLLTLSMLAGCTDKPDDQPSSEPPVVTTEPTTEPTEPTTEATEPTTEPTEATEPTTEATEPVIEIPDTAVEYVSDRWALTIPEGFVNLAEEETAVMWMAQDLSQIIVMTMPYNETILTMTEEDFLGTLAGTTDEDSVVIHSLTTTEIDGYPALSVEYSFAVTGVPVHGYYHFVLADQTYCFMFNDYTDNTRAEDFRQMVASIDILENTAG